MSGRPDGAPNLTPSLNAEVGYEADPERGIEVIKPHPGGSLALAGMVGGDFILSIEGRKLPGLREFVAELMKRVPGDTISARIWDSRQENFRNLSLEVGAKGRSLEEVRTIRSKAKTAGLTISVDVSAAEPSKNDKKRSTPSRAGAKKTPAGTPKATTTAGTPKSTSSAQRRASASIPASASHTSHSFGFRAFASLFSSCPFRHFFPRFSVKLCNLYRAESRHSEGRYQHTQAKPVVCGYTIARHRFEGNGAQ